MPCLTVGDNAFERGVAHAVHALVGLDLQGDEVAAGAGDNDLRGGDLHLWSFHSEWVR